MVIDQILAALADNGALYEDDSAGIRAHELLRLIESHAAVLAQAVPERARVLFPIRNTLSHVAILLACWQRGTIPILLNPACNTAQLRSTADRLRPHAFIVDPALARVLDCQVLGLTSPLGDMNIIRTQEEPDSLLEPMEASADIGIMTSGSTGVPRPALHRLASLVANARLHANDLGIEPVDRVGCFLPLFFSYGLVAGLLSAVLARATVVLSKPEGLTTGPRARQRRVTVLGSTPFVVRQLCSQPIDSLRLLTVGGDVLDPRDGVRLLQVFHNTTVAATYGLTEAGPRVATCRLRDLPLAEMSSIPLGRPLPGVELSDDDEMDGELVVRTPTAMLGYLGDRAATSATLLGEGVVRTGDLVCRHGDDLFFVGRRKRTIFRNGDKVFPALIEARLRQLPGVTDVWITGLTDSRAGQVPVAYIVGNGDATERSLVEHVRAALPSSHVPVEWTFVEHIPQEARRK